MVKKDKLDGFQKKLLSTIEQAESLALIYKERLPFSIFCVNDVCSARNGSRYEAIAWKTPKLTFKVYCDGCGQEEEFTKENFRERRKQMDHEQAMDNMEKARKNHINGNRS